MVVGCTTVGLPFYAWCASSGVTAAVPGSIPQQTTGVWSREMLHMLHPGPTCNTHQGNGVVRHGAYSFYPLPQWSLSIGPTFTAQTSTTAPGLAFEGGRFLQFNCNGIQLCHVELQDFLHRHQVLVACVQETKLGVKDRHDIDFKSSEISMILILKCIQNQYHFMISYHKHHHQHRWKDCFLLQGWLIPQRGQD